MNAFPPPHTPVPSHARHGSTSSVSSISQFQQPQQPFMPSPSTSTSTVNQTRILLLSNFNPALKTKDLIQLVSDRVPTASPADSFKLKWRDDTSCFVVFAEPFAAKRAFLRLIADPPAPLSPRETGTYAPCIHAYNGPDSAQIIQAVQNKQRSRSIAGMGAISGSAAAAAAAATGPSAGQSGGQSHGHHRTASWTRQSIDRRAAASQLAASIPTVPVADGAPSSPTRTRTTTNNSTTSEGDVSNRPGAGDSSYSWRAASPDVITSGTGASGVVAGEAPRRFGGGGGGGALGATKSD
ncbi:hypothetical protein C6P46_005834 [Rhodotorula mucilaginosa]|jgi:hypothetical protein|uniref:Uncharacterized protein n=1 Tax=Rhodotorula mucilaginosa TaxID=5537 RepID=A0A9P7B4X4_RHOMI|nr:hypothetical protein C6P46_005834 [Rhodotorula mucilaginosa]